MLIELLSSLPIITIKNLGIERFIAVTKIHYEKVHWNPELHQPHRVHDYMHCGYRIGH